MNHQKYTDAKLSYETIIIPAPLGLEVWLAFDGPDSKVDGPHKVLAIAFRNEKIQIVDAGYQVKDADGTPRPRDWDSTSNSADRAWIEYQNAWFYIATDDEEHWYEHGKYAFLTREVAELKGSQV